MTQTKTPTCEWVGRSGAPYIYYVYPVGTTFDAVPGNYIFTKLNDRREWVPIYAGETSDLSNRFEGHHKLPCVNRHGATHIHVHANNGGVDARRREERDIIAKYSPPCNG